jgi:hypothetical protein
MVFSLTTKPSSAGYGRITKGKKHQLKYVMWLISCITHMIDLVQSATLSSSGSLLVEGTPCQSLTCCDVILWNSFNFVAFCTQESCTVTLSYHIMKWTE